MRIPKLLVLAVVYGMCGIGLIILWSEKRKFRIGDDIADEAGLPVYK